MALHPEIRKQLQRVIADNLSQAQKAEFQRKRQTSLNLRKTNEAIRSALNRGKLNEHALEALRNAHFETKIGVRSARDTIRLLRARPVKSFSSSASKQEMVQEFRRNLVLLRARLAILNETLKDK